MQITSITTKFLILLLIAFPVLLSSKVQALEIERIGTSSVDEKSLTFAEGPSSRFGLSVNGRTHQQTPLTTYRGYQYVTYFNADRRVCIGRKELPDGPWEVIQFKDHRFKTNDSHNTTVLGICDTDGTIHMAFDHHASRLNYRISKLGAAHAPDKVKWDVSLFGDILHTLGSVGADKSVTYPRFLPAPNGNLLFYYRAVTSGNGHGMLEEYNGDKHDWTPGLGEFIARDMGTYTVDGKKSPYRCPYLNSISYAGKRLHVSWIWRDRFEKTHPRNQHDLCYAYSDDNGRTWNNSAGNLIGETGKTFIHLNTSGLTVSPIPTNTGLSNQNTHFAYPDGSIHIVMLQRPKGGKRNVYHHHWRTPDGIWKSTALPFWGSRPKIVGTKDQSLILAYTGRNQLRLAKGVPNSDKTRWEWSAIKLPGAHSCYGDALLDYERWEAENVLSIYSQEEPAKAIRTKQSKPINGHPSPLTIVDYRLKK